MSITRADGKNRVALALLQDENFHDQGTYFEIAQTMQKTAGAQRMLFKVRFW